MLSKAITLTLTVVAVFMCTSLALSTETNDTEINDTETSTVAHEGLEVTPVKDTVTDSGEKNLQQLQTVLAQEGDPEYGAYLAGDCLTCHVVNETNGTIPLIHGKPKHYLVSALLEYKNKQRTSTVMRGVAAALSNEEMAALVTYLSKQ